MQLEKAVKKYDTYKNSGIEWIGKIPQVWNVLPHKYIMSKVKNICEKYDGEDIISLTMKGVIKRDLDNPMGKMPLTFDGYQRIDTGNLLLCLFDIDVTPRCVGLIKDDGLTSPAYSQFKFLGQDCPQYYTYLLTMIDDDKCFLHLAKNLRSSLTENNFGAILTIQPPLDEQQQIADYLDKKSVEIDRVIETEKLVIEKLKEYKQSIITEAVTKGLDKSVPLKDSGIEWIGKIPQHWEIIKLKKTISLIADIDHYMPDTTDTGYSYLMTGDLKDIASKIDFENCKHISDSDYKDLSKKIHPVLDDVIFARYATIGTVCYVDIQKDFLVSYSCLTIRPNSEKLFGKFLYYYLISDTFKIEVSQYINSNTQSNVGLDSLQKVYIVLPNKTEQQQIAEYLDKKCSEIDKAIANKEQVIEKFTEYKTSLIYECVTGKRKVV